MRPLTPISELQLSDGSFFANLNIYNEIDRLIYLLHNTKIGNPD